MYLYVFRWRIVIHGAVDGYSRVIVFMAASNNNRQETVLQSFLGAVASYGLPSRVRTDCGGENNATCSVMELLQGEGRGSAIRGSSVHNQRIERLWLDMWNGATAVFHSLFHFMEQQQLLSAAVTLLFLHYTHYTVPMTLL